MTVDRRFRTAKSRAKGHGASEHQLASQDNPASAGSNRRCRVSVRKILHTVSTARVTAFGLQPAFYADTSDRSVIENRSPALCVRLCNLYFYRNLSECFCFLGVFASTLGSCEGLIIIMIIIVIIIVMIIIITHLT